MFEFQAQSERFQQALLGMLEAAAICPPPEIFGVQLQRIRLDGATLRHIVPGTPYAVFYGNLLSPDGVASESVSGLQTQLAIAAHLDFARTQTIEANANTLAASDYGLDLTIVVDLNCVSGFVGELVITRHISAVEFDQVQVTDASIPEWLREAIENWINANLDDPKGPYANDVAKLEAFVRDQVARSLPHQELSVDLSGLLTKGANFDNTGISVDAARTCLAIRAEPMNNSSATPGIWNNFLGGYFQNRLGANHWSVFLRATDLEYTLQTNLDLAMRENLGKANRYVPTVAVSYGVQNQAAVVTITPTIDTHTPLGSRDIPIAFRFWVDGQSGNFMVDIDAYGLRDFLDDVEFILDIVLPIIFPVVGIIPAIALNLALPGIERAVSNQVTTLAGPELDKIDPGSTFQPLPGPPFRYRAVLPMPLPGFVSGRVNELIAYDDGFAVAGSWATLNWRASDMSVDVSQFGWIPPPTSCAQIGMVQDTLKVDPQTHAQLYAQISIAVTGSSPISLCGVDILDDGGAPGGLIISPRSAMAPTDVGIFASADFANLPSRRAVRLRVRTSAGVFLAVLDPPQPMTQTDIDRVRQFIEIQREYCERILADWFGSRSTFKLDWIVDPLHDPDPDSGHPDFVHIDVTALPRDVELILLDAGDTLQARVFANSAGAARLTALIDSREAAPSLGLQFGRAHGGSVRRNWAGVSITRQRFARSAPLWLADTANSIVAVPTLGPTSFVVIMPDTCSLIHATPRGQPVLAGKWQIPGLRGVVATRAGAWAYGEAGVERLEAGGRSTPLHDLRRAPVHTAAASGRLIAFAHPDGVELCNAYGGRIRQFALQEVAALSLIGDFLLVSSASGVELYPLDDLNHPLRPRRLSDAPATRFVDAAMTGSTFAQSAEETWREVRRDGELGALHNTIPFEAGAAVAGGLIAKRDGALAIRLYRPLGPARLAIPRGATGR